MTEKPVMTIDDVSEEIMDHHVRQALTRWVADPRVARRWIRSLMEDPIAINIMINGKTFDNVMRAGVEIGLMIALELLNEVENPDQASIKNKIKSKITIN